MRLLGLIDNSIFHSAIYSVSHSANTFCVACITSPRHWNTTVSSDITVVVRLSICGAHCVPAMVLIAFYIWTYNKMRLFATLFPFHKWENWGSRKMPNKSNSKKSECVSHSVMCDTLQRYGLQPTRLLCPWASPGKNTGVGSHSLLQGIFPTQGSNLHLFCLLHWQMDSYHLSHQGSPNISNLPKVKSSLSSEPNLNTTESYHSGECKLEGSGSRSITVNK